MSTIGAKKAVQGTIDVRVSSPPSIAQDGELNFDFTFKEHGITVTVIAGH